jgi:1-acyl-sn-glycerol-3-phosphate acyltransferase
VTHDAGQLQTVARLMMKPVFAFSWRIRAEGLDHLPAGPAILCSNHVSVLDSFFIPSVLSRRITFVGKAEYLDDWKTRWLFPALGMIPIDRTGGDAASAALDVAAAVLARGELFGIYPEGTRSRDGLLHKGHTGPARLAFRTGVPIVPVGVRGTLEIMPPDARAPRLWRSATIAFGAPIDPARYLRRGDERTMLRTMTDEVMYEIRELSGQEYIHTYATKGAVAEAEVPEARSSVEVLVPRRLEVA